VSQRERWIIYPLLFFCFSMCIRLYWRTDFGAIHAESITTHQLSLENEDGRQAIFAGVRRDGAGYLLVYAPPPLGAAGVAPLEVVRLGASGQSAGVVETLSNIGQRTVELSSDGQGGRLMLFDTTGRPTILTRAVSHPTPVLPSDDPRTAPVRPPIPPVEAPSTAVGSDTP
jgi:hypothetical protein